MSENLYVNDRNGDRVILGMAPAKYDHVACTYDVDNNLTTATFYWEGTALSKITLIWSGGNMVDVLVGAP